MKRIVLLFSLLLVIVCFAACKDTDVYLSENDSSISDASSGFGIIITDDESTVSTGANNTNSSSALTQSELEQIASDWDEIKVEIEAATPSTKPETSSNTAVSSENKTSSVTSNKTSSDKPSSAESSSDDQDKTPESSSSEQPVSSEEPTSSKVTSLPDYYEGRY